MYKFLQCTLHFMLSSSVDLNTRNDESQRCGQLAQYRAYRYPRNVEFNEQIEGEEQVQEDEAVIEPEGEAAEDVPLEDEEINDEIEITGHQANPTNQISACPVENGVIRTLWGAINAGSLIAGIAAGLEPQTVSLANILDLPPSQMRARQAALAVDNRWAATLAGDAAEVALHQGPVGDIQVGASGAWNSTALPRWHFLSQNTRLEMTDAEIRGGIDGLVIGLNVREWSQQASQLRLSQVLEMYYSDVSLNLNFKIIFSNSLILILFQSARNF